MIKKILPQHPLARLYVGCFAVMASVGVTAVVSSMVANRVFHGAR